MKNWSTLEPDRVNLLNKHFSPSRGCNREELMKAVNEHE